MAWRRTRDVLEFESCAAGFLAELPVLNSPLLTETAYLTAVPSDAPDLLFGWWTSEKGEVCGAFVRAPGHVPLLSEMPTGALAELATELGDTEGLGVPEELADDAIAAWKKAGVGLTRRQAITVHRLERSIAKPAAVGCARVAGPADRALLYDWFEALMAGYPDDPTDREYVVDDPITFGGIILWEVDDVPVAMCGRSRTVAGTVRIGPCYAPTNRTDHLDAAFAAACAAASREARHVLVLAPAAADDEDGRLAAAGFTPVTTRVALGPEV